VLIVEPRKLLLEHSDDVGQELLTHLALAGHAIPPSNWFFLSGKVALGQCIG
jgi:hypothetical protein